MHRRHLACLLVTLMLAACGGGKSSPASTASETPPSGATAPPVIAGPGMDPHAQLNAVAAADPPAVASVGCFPGGPPRRLTRQQLINVLRDTTTQITGDASITADLDSLVIDTALFPPDTMVNPDTTRHKGFERLDTQLTTRQVQALQSVAQTLATRITSDSARVTKLLGSCSSDATTCMSDFARRVGRQYFRAPLTDNEASIYGRAAGGATSASAMAKVLASMMVSPKTYLIVEAGQTSGGDANCKPLTAHELASRLSMQFWDTVPDAALAAAADDGSLLTPAVYAQQVTRLVNDARADAPLRRFFSGWLRLEDLAAMDGNVGDPKFDSVAGSFKPLPTTRAAAINETLDMVSYLAAHGGSLQQVLTDRHSYARSSDISTLVQTPVWDGVSTPPTFTEPTRVGLLTRVALLASGGSSVTLPIQRGIRILGALTCQTLPPPAMNQTNSLADLSGVLSTRTRTERITQMPATSCAGCHVPMINPWGFVFEGFDPLGRVRTEEVVRDDKGNQLGVKPLNLASVARLSGQNPRAIASPAEAQQMILESGHLERCFAQSYLRYTFGRTDTPADADLIDSLRRDAAAGTNLRSLMASVALRREFSMIAKGTTP